MGILKVKAVLPDALKNATKTSYYIKQAFLAKAMKDTATTLSKSGATVTITSKRMEATIGKLANRGVVDLKPFFMRSSKVKRKKNGGWYLVIPMNISSRSIIRTSGRATYDRIVKQFSSLSPGEQSTLNVEGMLQRVQHTTLPSLVPPAPYSNITAKKHSNGRNTYTMFRTVSDKSAPTSWVLNRNNVNQNNTSQTLEHEVGVLIRKRIQQTYG